MLTFRLPGMVPLAGETLSHWPPPVVLVALAEKVPVPPPTSETVSDWGCGLEPPTWKLTGASDDGLTVMVGEPGPVLPPTFRLTWNENVPDVVPTVTVPE